MAHYSVAVTILEGRNLQPADPSDTEADPYCVVHCGGKKEKTQVVSSTLNPFWNETFKFGVAQGDIEIEVYDKDFLSDTFLGKVSIAVAGAGASKWYPLVGKSGRKDPNIGGDLKIKVVSGGSSTSTSASADRSALMGAGASGSGQRSPRGSYKVGGGARPAYKHQLPDEFKEMNDDDERLPEQERATRQKVRQAESTAKASKESMQRTLAKLNETEQVGQETLTTLNEQGQQIRRMQDSVDRIDDNLDDAEEDLKKIDSVSYSIFRHFKPKKKKDGRNSNAELDSKMEKQRAKDEKRQAKEDKKSGNKSPRGEAGGGGRSWGQPGGAQRHPDELGILSDEAQNDIDETDEMLDQMGNGLGNLKAMANAMNRELDEQNAGLDNLSTGLDRTNRRVNKDTKYVDKLIKDNE